MGRPWIAFRLTRYRSRMSYKSWNVISWHQDWNFFGICRYLKQWNVFMIFTENSIQSNKYWQIKDLLSTLLYHSIDRYLKLRVFKISPLFSYVIQEGLGVWSCICMCSLAAIEERNSKRWTSKSFEGLSIHQPNNVP